MSMMTRSQAAAAALKAQRHPQADDTFRIGLQSVFRQWTALNLAVAHGWGGPQSQMKADILLEDIMRTFQGPEKIYKDDIALILEDSMDTDFNTLCEDGSSEEVGELLVTLWRQCAAGEFSQVEIIVAKEKKASDVLRQSRGIDRGDEMDSDDENDGLDVTDALEVAVAGTAGTSTSATARIDSSSTATSIPHAMQEAGTSVSMVDPDGWEVAGSRRNKRR